MVSFSRVIYFRIFAIGRGLALKPAGNAESTTFSDLQENAATRLTDNNDLLLYSYHVPVLQVAEPVMHWLPFPLFSGNLQIRAWAAGNFDYQA